MWKLNTDERIARWRDFRKSLDVLDLEAALGAVADFWQSCPVAPYYLELSSIEQFPSPWQLISENYYCDLAKALGIVYTIYFTKHWTFLDPEIRIYKDSATGYMYNLSIFMQGKYVLNYQDGTVVNIESINKSLELVQQISTNDLRLQEY